VLGDEGDLKDERKSEEGGVVEDLFDEMDAAVGAPEDEAGSGAVVCEAVGEDVSAAKGIRMINLRASSEMERQAKREHPVRLGAINGFVRR
jgi:hypothetical protein